MAQITMKEISSPNLF